MGTSAKGGSPVLVSFFSGQNYEAAGRQLREDCLRLGIDSDIVELPSSPGETWLSICRRKIPFYLEMHRKHRRPILWLDVDSRLANYPHVLNEPNCDTAGFLRGFRYLRDFDPQANQRFFAPFALYFDYNPRVTAFLELMADLESKFESSATDDYFLQEAWKQHQEQLSVMVLPPDLVGHEWPLTGRQQIYIGISGNVSKFKDRAQQHVAEMLTPPRRKMVLLNEAGSLRRAGQIADALVFYRRALAIDPADTELAGKISRLERQAGR